VKNDATLSGFNLGDGLRTVNGTDFWVPYSLFAGRDVSWSDGTLNPTGVAGTPQGPMAYAYVGGTFTAPTYLTNIRQGSTNQDASFNTALTYYEGIQADLAALPTNVVYEIKYTNGLFLNCTSASEIYHLQISDVDFNQVVWYSLSGCTFSARWIIDITGTGSVSFQGEPFQGIVERVVYNILGSGRTITANNGVAGHILSPQNTYSQSQGVTYGILIVGNVLQARQNNKPNCIYFSPVTISTIIVEPVTIGDVTIYVADLANFIAGDLICIGGDCHKIVSGESITNPDGSVGKAVTVDQGFTASHTSDSILSTTTSDYTQNRNNQLVPAGGITTANANTMGMATAQKGGAAALTISSIFVAFFAALF